MRAVLAGLVVIILCAYGVLFFSWNDGPLQVVTLADPVPLPTDYGVQATVGGIVLGAAGVGALVMAILVGVFVTGQRGAHTRTAAKLRRTQAKLEELVEKFKEQRARLQLLERESLEEDLADDDLLLDDELEDDTL
jgi:hypothetical protein